MTDDLYYQFCYGLTTFLYELLSNLGKIMPPRYSCDYFQYKAFMRCCFTRSTMGIHIIIYFYKPFMRCRPRRLSVAIHFIIFLINPFSVSLQTSDCGTHEFISHIIPSCGVAQTSD
ncbi:hypothetical protein D1007_28415 [Hordeum vulgare]|uniref:Predicted protein n=1 Tax=Hordeum vulgare subsp. vulgare TaxID=112509 RepID=F2DXT4_HORVV|nr:hypothetical protein D1007_28415 [Hordeum vulgare]BAJ99905.1 predicted protein [Hordeum vulgare subsp. vulgare]